MTITINAQASDVITINISDADQITLNTTAIVIASDGVSVAWGEITGTLSDQTDLQDALDLKLDAAALSDAGAILPTDQLVIYRNGVPLRTTVAQLGLAPTPPSGDLLLVPTGATESADGEYQRFVYDGGHAYEVALETFYPIWHAELSAQDRQSEYQIKLKMPELTDDQAVNVFITEADISLAALLERDFNYLALELRATDGSTGLLLNIADDQENSSNVGLLQPAAGSVITLTLTTTSLDYVYDGGTGSIAIPAGFFANPPNIWAYSGAMSAADVLPLSIKVLHTE